MNEQMMTRPQSRAGEYQESRALSEIKGKMYLARQFPRDQQWALNGLLQECERPELAEMAQYEYPKGDSVVKGPSIRLVEVLARHWGNIDSGVNEIETSDGSTLIKAYAWDLETNVSDEKTFSVKHERTVGRGENRYSKKLTDERDIYEMVANKGARRKRACLLSVLPGWYVDAAVKACEETLKKSLTAGKSMEEVRESIVSAFAEFDITPEQIEAKMGRGPDALSKNDVVKLRHLYASIKDGFINAKEVFEAAAPVEAALPSSEEQESLDSLNEQLGIGGRSGGADEG